MIKKVSGRVAVPVLLLLALGCFRLPFLTVSWEAVGEGTADILGWYLAFGGAPHALTPGTFIPLQPAALATFVVIAAGVAVTAAWPRRRWWAAVLVGATAATLLAFSYVTTRQFLVDTVVDYAIPIRNAELMIGKLVWLSTGYWLTLALLVAVIGLGVLGIVGEYRAARPRTPATR